MVDVNFVFYKYNHSRIKTTPLLKSIFIHIIYRDLSAILFYIISKNSIELVKFWTKQEKNNNSFKIPLTNV